MKNIMYRVVKLGEVKSNGRGRLKGRKDQRVKVFVPSVAPVNTQASRMTMRCSGPSRSIVDRIVIV